MILFNTHTTQSIKANQALNNRSTKFNKGVFHQKISIKKEFNFKNPTPEELETSNRKNQRYIQKQKRTARTFLIISIILGLWIMNFLVGGFFHFLKSTILVYY